MSVPANLSVALKDGFVDSPVACSRCGTYDYPDEMVLVDGERLCKSCAEVSEESA
jgi:formylmethanofuran dehydrogenase subunit E